MSTVNLETSVDQLSSGRLRRNAFYFFVLLFVVGFSLMLTLLAPLLPLLFTGWFDGAHLAEHQFHDVIASGLMWSVLIGVAAQLYKPTLRIGWLRVALLALLAINVSLLLGNFIFPPIVIFLVVVAVIAALHPARAQLFTAGPLNTRLLVLALVAAVPLLLFVGNQINIQRQAIAGDTHAEFGHWGLMAGYGLAIVLLSVSAALQSNGRRIACWAAGLLAVLIGVGSLVMPHMASAFQLTGAIGAVVWGALFIYFGRRNR